MWHLFDQITRVCGESDRALLFRGWNRLCLHAASVASAEGALASATVFAKAARAEAMGKEAESAAARAEVAAAKEEAQRATTRGSMLETQLKLKVKGTEQVLRQHQLRRMRMLVRTYLRGCLLNEVYCNIEPRRTLTHFGDSTLHELTVLHSAMHKLLRTSGFTHHFANASMFPNRLDHTRLWRTR